jgi:prephenate dehydrogenase
MKIGIIGLGIIGGSYAKALKPYGYEIVGIDINQESIDYALKNNIIDNGATNAKDFLGECEVVFVCLYPKQTVSFIKENIRRFKRNALIIDVAGIKRKMIDRLEMYFDDELEFVFTHPIAGSEKTGIQNSDAKIFKDANFIITPHRKNDDEKVNVVKTFAKQIGFGKITLIDDVTHDKMIAFTSQLTHAIAVSLVNSDPYHLNTSSFIGDSYKDLTRIAMINDALWTELFIENKDFLTQTLDSFIEQTTILRDALKTKDIDTLQSIMKKSTTIRKGMKNEK